jgi:hypothetical protein
MNYAREHIANWAGYRVFQEALEKVGWAKFPILRRELPNANGGLMSPESARQALLELDQFRQCQSIGKHAVLIDTKTGFLISQHVSAYQGVFIYGGRSGLEAGVDEAGFFIRDRDSQTILFQATRIIQRLLDPVAEGKMYEGQVEFRDLDTMQAYVCPIVVHGSPVPWPDGRVQNDKGEMRFEHSEGFHVERRKTEPSDFEHVLTSLTKVFEASTVTGNPVRWC